MPLNDIQIRKLRPSEKPFRTSDGEGLFLEVKPNGSKLWRMAYRFDGKQKLLSFGSYPAVSLARARERRLEAKILMASGIDPNAQKKEEKAEAVAQTENTFGNIAGEVIDKKRREGRAETTLTKMQWYLSLAEPDLGKRPIADIKSAEALAVLRKVEGKGNYESARKLRGFVGEVFRYAIATARAEYDPTFALKGALTTVSVKLMALLYPRPGELRLSRWNEFDLKKRVWTIPEERAKMRRPHEKPLPDLAVEIIKDMRSRSSDSEFVFRSDIARGKAISEGTMTQALRRFGFSADEMTPHGFRATASTLLNESSMWNADAIEAELAHVGADQVRKAYHRARYWDERVQMADWWAGQIEGALT